MIKKIFIVLFISLIFISEANCKSMYVEHMTNEVYESEVQAIIKESVKNLKIKNEIFDSNTNSSKDIIFLQIDYLQKPLTMASGDYMDREIKWINKKAKKYRNKPIVVIQYIPLKNKSLPSDNLWNTQDYINALKKNNNIATFIVINYVENEFRKETQDEYTVITPIKSVDNKYILMKYNKRSGESSASLI